jgi:hypothetical protein
LDNDVVSYAGSATAIELAGSVVKAGTEEDQLSSVDELVGG